MPSAPQPPKLLELQQAMRRALIPAGADAACAPHIIAEGLEPSERLAIYRNTILGKLTTALRLNYPAVQKLVGGEFFEGAARCWIEEQLPQSANLDEYGAEFAEFLAHFAPAASVSYLSDVARLEWAVNRALHAPEAEPLELARLTGLADAERGAVRFVPHPALALVRTDFPADTIWRAVLGEDEAALSTVDLSAGSAWLLVERCAGEVSVSRLSEPAWRFAFELCAGRPLYEALESAPGIEAHGLLAQHLAAGHFVDLVLEPRPRAEGRLSS